jgi:hypothetical protein
MLRALTPVLVVCCVQMASAQSAQSAGSAQSAQSAWRFRWQAGQILTYRVEQQTRSFEVEGSAKIEIRTKVSLVKRWRVLSVDKDGVATIQHSLVSLRLENTAPSGETLLFDSTNPDKSDPQLREQMTPYVGVPLSTLNIDALGRLVAVKESKFGPASRYEAELPFLITLPEKGASPGQSWQRTYPITLEPPQGTGEKYNAMQTYTCKRIEGAGAVLGVQTEMKTQPEALADRTPLLRFQPEGEVVFDIRSGRLHSALLRVKKELKGHQGEGSSYLFESTYSERYVDDR